LTRPPRCLIVSKSFRRKTHLEKEEESMAGKADFINSIVDAVDGLTKRQATAAFEAV